MSIQENNQQENVNPQQGNQQGQQFEQTTGNSPISDDNQFEEQSNGGDAGGLGDMDEQRKGSDADYATDEEGVFGAASEEGEDLIEDDDEQSDLEDEDGSNGTTL
ncbi:MAG: hypothetical protein EOO42_02530 [Flavobacteriales bacterium]|nr:MAG: hypothetical protein EOO42_02530 [Flavobacteriales bacterium]